MRNTHAYFGSTFRSHHLPYSFHLGVLLHSQLLKSWIWQQALKPVINPSCGFCVPQMPLWWPMTMMVLCLHWNSSLQVSLLAHSTTPFGIRGHTTHKLINSHLCFNPVAKQFLIPTCSKHWNWYLKLRCTYVNIYAASFQSTAMKFLL